MRFFLFIAVLAGAGCATSSGRNAPVQFQPPPVIALPDGYEAAFGGWATEQTCPDPSGCASAPKQLPPHIQVRGYTSALSPSSRVVTGETVHVCSRIAIAAGKDHKPGLVMEGIVLSTKTGESGRLIKGINKTGGGGEFHTDFALELPKDVPSGRYTAKTTLFLDKQAVDAHMFTFDVGPGVASADNRCSAPSIPVSRK